MQERQQLAKRSSSIVQSLQSELKKQFLLLEREQREKSKIKKEIEQNILAYYSVYIEKWGLGKVVENDGLGNSYNFVKDIILNVSKDVDLGVEILTLASGDDVEDLTNLMLSMFYDSFTESDPYLKKNTKFGVILAKKISQSLLKSMKTNMKNIKQSISLVQIDPNLQTILNQYLKQECIREYFQMLGNKILNAIPESMKEANILSRWGSLIDIEEQGSLELNPINSISLDKSASFLSSQEMEIESKIEELVDNYINDMLNKAELVPVALRWMIYIIRRSLPQVSEQEKNKFIWQILGPEYLRTLTQSSSKKWSNFKNSYYSETVKKVKQTILQKINEAYIEKIIDKICMLNEHKLQNCTLPQNIENFNKKRIIINGGCISYQQVYILFKIIKANEKHLKNFNERVANRICKVNQISPNFEMFLQFDEPETSFLVFIELVYGEIIEKDYLALYQNCYKDNIIKKMLKQILSDPDFHLQPYLQNNLSFLEMMEKIVQQQESVGDGVFESAVLQYSAQFVMKIKYLTYLIRNEGINEQVLFETMISQCKQRQEQNICLFQDNKIQLLQSLTTVEKAKKIVIANKEHEKKVDLHLRAVNILDTMEISLCITSPSTRSTNAIANKYTQFNQGQTKIIIENSNECYHQENIIEGQKHHAHRARDAIIIFCELKQVKSSFLSGKDKVGVYPALCFIIESFMENCRKNYHITMQEYSFFEKSLLKIVLRSIHEILLESSQKNVKDIEFLKKAQNLSFVKPHKLRLPGCNASLTELEQVWEIVCQYINSIQSKKTPKQKIDSFSEMTEILRISIMNLPCSLPPDESSSKLSIQILTAYCLIRSRPPKIISNLNFIELFHSKDKLLSREGAILERMKNAVALVTEEGIRQYLAIDQSEFNDEVERNQTANTIENMKKSLKTLNSSAYT